MVQHIKLPHKLSACMKLALSDLRKVERSGKYVVEMDEYYHCTPPGEGRCIVCFAGSIIAKTCGADPSEALAPGDFGLYNEVRLRALDHLRRGNIDLAFDAIDKNLPFGITYCVDVTPYAVDPFTFKMDMKKIAKLLEQVGE